MSAPERRFLKLIETHLNNAIDLHRQLRETDDREARMLLHGQLKNEIWRAKFTTDDLMRLLKNGETTTA